MRYFNWRKKSIVKKELKESEHHLADVVNATLEQQEVNLHRPEERKAYIKSNCEQILEAMAQVEEFASEYEMVTSYLTDISRIDEIPREPLEEVKDSARKVLTLTRERAQFQNSNPRLTSSQYRMIEVLEEQVPDEVKKMKEKEAYQSLLKHDMSQLEGEKGRILYEFEEIRKRQAYLRTMSIVICVCTVSITWFFLWLRSGKVLQNNLPLYATIALALISAAIIIPSVIKTQQEYELNGRKKNKAIRLLNTVKIKYINNQSSLEYGYQKFGVNNSARLTFLWDEYVKQKELEKKYQNNTELLHYYTEKLVKQLRDYQLYDPEIWIHQCAALLDAKEMVEVRHRLHVRRQKLRDRLEMNLDLKEESIKNIRNVVKKQPSARGEVVQLLSEYKITIE